MTALFPREHFSQSCQNGSLSIHLGTQAALSPDNSTYVAIMHVVGLPAHQNYSNYVYEFSRHPPYRILRISVNRLPQTLTPHVKTHGFTYTSSLVRLRDQPNKYMLGYGVADVAASLNIISWEQLTENMETVGVE